MGPEGLCLGDVLVNQKHTGIVYKDLSTNTLLVIHASSINNGVVCSILEDFIHECGGDNVEIFRNTNTSQVAKAVTLAYKTAKQGLIKYDWGRLLQANFFSDQLNEAKKKSNADVLALLHATFEISGLFRAIKYASRRNHHLLKSTDNYVNKRGLRCAFFLCLCFQIAAIEDQIEPISSTNKNDWVSNKYTDKIQLNQLQQNMPKPIFERYKSFIEKPVLAIEDGKLIQKEVKKMSNDSLKYRNSALKRTPIKYNELLPAYKPALFQWRNKAEMGSAITEEKLESQLTRAMMVDAKYCTARDLLTLLKEDTKYWQPEGILQLQINSPNLNRKKP